MVRTLLAAAFVAVSGMDVVAQDGGKIPWIKDPKAGFKEAKKSGKPMMLFFTSDG